MSSNFEQIATQTEAREGLYSQARNDAGNWTSGIVGIGRLAGSMRGISAATMARWLGSPDDVTPSVMRAIDHATFLAIARAFYWRVLSCDSLRPGVCRMVFDFGFHAGVGRSARQLQKLAGVRQDGDIGPTTLAALAATDIGLANVSAPWLAEFQKWLGVEPDGVGGPVTLEAMVRRNDHDNTHDVLLVYALATAQEAAYRSFKGFSSYGDGWLNRLRWRVGAALSDMGAA